MDEATLHTGRFGESRAWAYYEERGWTLLARNYRAGPKEIDLVVRRGALVAFVEVKTRRTTSGGDALEQVGARKRKQVSAAARHWIHNHGEPGQRYRFDAVAIDMTGATVRVVHVPDAWRLP